MTCRILVCQIAPLSKLEPYWTMPCLIPFLLERLTQSLRLPRINQKARITGVVASVIAPQINLLPTLGSHLLDLLSEKLMIVALKVTCDLRFSLIPSKEWNHLDGIELADPGFDCPRRIDVLVGIGGDASWPVEWTSRHSHSFRDMFRMGTCWLYWILFTLASSHNLSCLIHHWWWSASKNFGRWKRVPCQKLLTVLKNGLLFSSSRQVRLVRNKDGGFIVPLPKRLWNLLVSPGLRLSTDSSPLSAIYKSLEQ